MQKVWPSHSTLVIKDVKNHKDKISAMAFSGALILTDLNDYIAPSQACVKPVEVKKSVDSEQGSIIVDSKGTYYEVSRDGEETQLKAASISLNDCLACSGCITSAESVLITMQSQEELYTIIKNNREAAASGDVSSIRHIVVSLSPQSRTSIAARYGLSPLQVHRKITYFFKSIGVDRVFDTSFSRDFALLESAREFVERFRRYQGQISEGPESERIDMNDTISTENGIKTSRRSRGSSVNSNLSDKKEIPMLASSCPGWICYAEKTHGYVLPFVSETKSPQQIMGSIVKNYWAEQIGITPDKIYHVCVMPCYDKKLEASRQDFYDDIYRTRDVDCVITTTEVEAMFAEQSQDIQTLPEDPLENYFTKFIETPEGPCLAGVEGSSSGGQLEFILTYAARELFNIDICVAADSSSEAITVRTVRNSDFKEYTLQYQGRILLQFAAAYGFRNIQNLVRKIKNGKSPYHFIEVMACPSGCINGGGQLQPPDTEVFSPKQWIAHIESLYRSVKAISPEKNEVVARLYSEWLEYPGSKKANMMLRTQYHAVTQNLVNPLAVKW